jgi:alpha-galactosidase
MNLQRLVAVSFMAAATMLWGCSSGNDLTGQWVFERSLDQEGGSAAHSGGGPMRDSVLDIIQDGAELTGTVKSHLFDMPITGGVVNADHVSFVVTVEMAKQKVEIPFKGRIVNDGIAFMVMGPGGMPPMNVLFRRATADEVAQRVGVTPAKIEPPPIEPLPDNGLARTPPMGWNSWNCFHQDIDDQKIREIADAMVDSGMRDAGYTYLNIDDGWQGTRDEQGVLHPNDHFPDMKALGDYIHSKGLKFGIYSSPGPRTCGNQEGSYGHEEQDAQMFADWGVDYIKYDWCGAFRIYQPSDMQAIYQKMGRFLRDTGRPIVYSLCQYGMEEVWKWGPQAGGNLWRTTGDIGNTWDSMSEIGFQQSDLAEWAGPGHWNDPDMLEVGNGGMSLAEERSHFTLWSILAAPLLAGNDLRTMTPETLEILTNPEVIAVNQDPLGKQARRVWKEGDLEVWSKPLSENRVAAALFNRGDQPASVTAKWSDLGIKGQLKVRDAWAKKDLGAHADAFKSEVEPHGAVLVVIQRR